MRKEATQQWRKPPQERKKPSGKEERGALKWWGVYWGVLTVVYWAHGGRRWFTGVGTMAVATSGHKEAHPSSSSSGCLGSDAAALKLRLGSQHQYVTSTIPVVAANSHMNCGDTVVVLVGVVAVHD